MLEEAFYQHMTANPRRSRTRATRGRTGWTDATASHHLPRSQPASGLRRQPELCQQTAEVTAQNGVAVGMVSGCGQTTRTTVNSSTCLASPICHGTRTCLHNVSMVSLMCSGSVGHASMIVPIRARSCSSVSCDCSHSAATREGWWHNSLSPQLVVCRRRSETVAPVGERRRSSCQCTRHGFGVTCRGCRLAGTRMTFWMGQIRSSPCHIFP